MKHLEGSSEVISIAVALRRIKRPPSAQSACPTGLIGIKMKKRRECIVFKTGKFGTKRI
jgi:hypothetical protein